MTDGMVLDTKEVDRIMRVLKINEKQLGKVIAFEAEAEMKKRAAVDTSAMRNSIYVVTQDEDGYGMASGEARGNNDKVETSPHPKPTGDTLANVGPSVNYAEFVEFGTSKMAAQPFVVPGAETVFNKFNNGEFWNGLVK
jgi:HK97 gp10 family phage protein